MDLTKIRLDSYRAAVDQAQRYLVLALTTAVAAWLLRHPSVGTAPINPGGIFVPVDASTARDLLLALHTVSAAMAGYTVELATRLATYLNKEQDVATAAYDNPSIVCSPWPGVRLAVPIISVIVATWTQIVRAPVVTSALFSALYLSLLLAPHVVLSMYLWLHPSGKFSPIKFTRRQLVA